MPLFPCLFGQRSWPVNANRLEKAAAPAKRDFSHSIKGGKKPQKFQFFFSSSVGQKLSWLHQTFVLTLVIMLLIQCAM
jgi:hypothetical protein